MKFALAVTTLTAMAALGGVRPALQAQNIPNIQSSPQSTKNVWDGVYTQEQSKRGRAQYNDQCASCHGAELSGGEMAPPLAGNAFLTNWDGETAGSLEERIRITMPQGAEGTLSRQQVVDIIASVLAANDVPAGQTELPKELEILKQIQITAKKP
jgi:S-disulfanyl-L-cysteine oxidoreductase SoxD